MPTDGQSLKIEPKSRLFKLGAKGKVVQLSKHLKLFADSITDRVADWSALAKIQSRRAPIDTRPSEADAELGCRDSLDPADRVDLLAQFCFQSLDFDWTPKHLTDSLGDGFGNRHPPRNRRQA